MRALSQMWCCHARVRAARLLMWRQRHRVGDDAVGGHGVDIMIVLSAELMAVDLVLGHDTERLSGLVAARCVVAAARTAARTHGVIGSESAALAL